MTVVIYKGLTYPFLCFHWLSIFFDINRVVVVFFTFLAAVSFDKSIHIVSVIQHNALILANSSCIWIFKISTSLQVLIICKSLPSADPKLVRRKFVKYLSCCGIFGINKLYSYFVTRHNDLTWGNSFSMKFYTHFKYL